MNGSVRLIRATDVHLNHVDVAHWDRWNQTLRESISSGKNRASGLILTGDISEADDVVFQLRRIAESISVPIYFVLGNHDFYQGSIARTRAEVIGATRSDGQIRYLTDTSPQQIVSGVYLVGEDGWGDATIGDYQNSPVRLNDLVLIEEFQTSSPALWPAMLQKLGKESADRLRDKLLMIPEDARRHCGDSRPAVP